MAVKPSAVVPGVGDYPYAGWVAAGAGQAPSILYGYERESSDQFQIVHVETDEGALPKQYWNASGVVPVVSGDSPVFLSFFQGGDVWHIVQSTSGAEGVAEIEWPSEAGAPVGGHLYVIPHHVRAEALVVHWGRVGGVHAGALDVPSGTFSWWARLTDANPLSSIKVTSAMKAVSDSEPDWAVAWNGQAFGHSRAGGGLVVIDRRGVQRQITPSDITRAHYEVSGTDSPSGFPGGLALNGQVLYVGLPGMCVGLGAVVAWDLGARRVLWESPVDRDLTTEALGESVTFWPRILGHEEVLAVSSNGVGEAAGRIWIIEAEKGAVLGRAVLSGDSLVLTSK